MFEFVDILTCLENTSFLGKSGSQASSEGLLCESHQDKVAGLKAVLWNEHMLAARMWGCGEATSRNKFKGSSSNRE